MANVRQLKDHGAPIFPITHVSLVKGMEYRALMDATYAWDGTGTPDVSKIPAGVVVTYNGTDYTGTLVASASTTGRFYLVPSTTVQGEWDRYMTDGTGSSYAWKAAGNTSIPSPAVVDNETTDDPTKPHSAAGGKRLKDQLGELEAKVDDNVESQVESTNLFNKAEADDGYYIRASDGVSVSYSGKAISGYIPIPVGTTEVSMYKGNNGGAFGSAEYAADKTFIAGHQQGTYSINANTKYIRFTMKSEDIDAAMFVVGPTSAIPSSYDPYKEGYYWKGWRIADNSIPSEKLLQGSVNSGKIADLAVESGKIAQRAVTLDKLAFSVSKNMLNTADPDVMLGYAQNSGEPYANSDYNLSGYIPVVPGEHIVLSYNGAALQSARYVAYFNENKVWQSYDANLNKIVVPSGIYYIRLTCYALYWNKQMVERGDEYSAYEPYHLLIPDSVIAKSVNPECVLPRKTFILSGTENSIYYRNVFNWLTDDYVISTNWTYRKRCARTLSASGDLNISLQRASDLGNVLTARSQVAMGLPATNNGTIKVNTIGSSSVYNGFFVGKATELCPDVECVGMRQCYGYNILADGRGGWTLSGYKNNPHLTNSYEGFSPLIHPAGYKYYGVTGFWKDIVNNNIGTHGYDMNGFDAYKTWFGTDGKKLNPSANDMMWDSDNSKYIYFNGTSWVDFVGTPDFVFDYGKYLDVWQIPTPDYVVYYLGINDFFNSYSDAAAAEYNALLAEFIASVRDYSSTIKIAICTTSTISSLPNSNYGYYPEGRSRNLWNGRKNTIKTFDTAEYEADNVFVVDMGACLDPDFGFGNGEILPFAFYTGDAREPYASNGVHPSNEGYSQMGVCVAGFLQYTR